MIDWQAVLDDHQIPWRNRGKNTSKKDINICCPFCGDDQGFHLGISIDNPTNYYCFRDPSNHSGRSYPRLLSALGLNTMEIQRILRDYDNAFAMPEAKLPDPDSISSKWRLFDRASNSDRMLAYMLSRGFSTPIHTANQFDLRYAPIGRWAQRLLFPFYEGNQVVSWAGRSVRESLTPKMLMQDNQHPGLIYTPRLRMRPNSILVEGQIDALKCAVAREDYFPIAVSGKALTEARMYRLVKLLSEGFSKVIYLTMDADVNLSTRMSTVIALRGILGRLIKVEVLPLPPHYDDPGEMPISVVRKWLP